MPATIAQLGFSPAIFAAFLESRHEPDWLTDLRRAAWQTFLAKAWPDRREEEWIRTDIRLFNLDAFSLPLDVPASAADLPRQLLNEGVELAGNSTSLNSQPVDARLDPKWASRGVLFGSLDELLVEHGDRLRPHFEKRLIQPGYDKFAALQAACWSGGHLLYVPRGVVIDQPLHFFNAMSDGQVDLSHTVVILDEGAEATVTAETGNLSPSDSGFHCGGTEIVLSAGARLRFVNLQDWGHGVWHFAHQRAIVGRDASLQWTIAALGSRLAKVNQQVALVGPGAECQVNGVLFTEDKQHISYHTLQHHQAPHCKSDFLYKSALQDKSRTVWRGMIKVDPKAQKTDGYQRNDNLLLSAHARADSIPGLEIQADDVRCTHGSTSGKVDEELIFYARCRGFTRKEAIRIIVTGFFQQVFDRITIDSVRDALSSAIARRVRDYA